MAVVLRQRQRERGGGRIEHFARRALHHVPLAEEQHRGRRAAHAPADRHHLAQDAGELLGELAHRAEPVPRGRGGGPAQQPIEGLVLREHRLPVRRGQRPVPAVRVHQVERRGEQRQRAPDTVDVRARARSAVRPGVVDLRRREAAGGPHAAARVRSDLGDRAEVDEFHPVPGLHDVLRLVVAVGEAGLVQVAERGQRGQDVRERLGHRQPAAGVVHLVL